MTEPTTRPAFRVTPPPASERSPRQSVRATINGRTVEGEVESRLLLVDFLRHRLGLTGTHVGCEQGSCGACTVLIDGSAVRSCLVLAVQANGRDLRTVEDLADPDGPLAPLQQAFTDEHGLQCGFCTPGFLCSLTALADAAEAEGRPVGEEELADHLDGNYCRCTGYVNIRRAARAAFGLPVERGVK